MITNLLEGKNHLEHKSLTLEERLLVGSLNFFDSLHGVLQRLVVEGCLTLSEQGQLVLLYLVGQVVDNGLVGLQTTHEEGGGNATETLRHMFVTLSLDRIGEVFLEALGRAEVTAIAKVHDAPELRQAVLDGRAAHGYMGISRNAADGLALGGVGILDVLCLIDDGNAPRQFFQFGDVGAKDTVGGEEDVGNPSGRTAGHTFSREWLQGALRAVIGEDGELRGKAMKLGLPVGDEAGGDNDEHAFLVKHPLVLHTLQQGDDL